VANPLQKLRKPLKAAEKAANSVTFGATDAIGKIVRIVPRSRNTELMLLLFAIGLNAFELAQVQLSVLQVLRSDIWNYLLPPTFLPWPCTSCCVCAPARPTLSCFRSPWR